MKSNIIAASNVYMSREDIPFRDPECTKQILEYDRVKDLVEEKKFDSKIPNLTDVQERILEIGMRCIYAKNDPCFGYVDEGQHSKCACINEECPQIMKCNPDYTKEDRLFWTTTKEDRFMYGDPSRLREYYFVDIVSDDEMLRYECNPYNDGIEFPLMAEPIKDDNKKKQSKRTKIDPITGRKMIVVGHKWMITDNASYENDELVSIWGFADEVEEIKPRQERRKKAKRIEKLDVVEKKKPRRNSSIENGYENRLKYESIVKEIITDKIRLGSVEDENDLGDKSIIICDNPAELSLISEGFVQLRIEHGYNSNSNIRIVVIDELDCNEQRNNVFVTTQTLEKGCINERYVKWKYLSEQSMLTEFALSNHSYLEYKFDNHTRWCCQNMYGITHICMHEGDFSQICDLSDGLYDIILFWEENTKLYRIEDIFGTFIGEIAEGFIDDLSVLRDKNEIQEYPSRIEGIRLEVKNNQLFAVLGMGHLEFDYY